MRMFDADLWVRIGVFTILTGFVILALVGLIALCVWMIKELI